ncbi:AAA family ATPase [Gemmatimonas sp.]|uniref:AAA family ATPase n=1 Tax=Gemmatimonas sp. TaxID=1962908 RepID=UPI00333EA510
MQPDRNLPSTDDALAAIEANDAAKRASGLQLLTYADLMAKPKDVPCLVERLIPEAGLVVLWGTPGSGKTFVALDLAHRIAMGMPWRDRAVVASDVVYVAAEGASGLPARAQSWCEANDVENPTRMRYLTQRLTLDVPAVRAELLAAIAATGVTPRLLVLDTLSANGPDGFNENATDHMKVAMDASRSVRDALGCTVLWVHHPGWTDDRLRGARDLQGTVDIELKLSGGPGGGPRVMKVMKARDFAAGDTFPMHLEPFGASCVMRAQDASAETLTPSQRAVLVRLAEHRAELPATATKWMGWSGYGRSQFFKIIDELKNLGFVRQERKGYTLTDLGEEQTASVPSPDVSALLSASLPHAA